MRPETTFGINLRAWRKKHGITPRTVAFKTDISLGHYRHIEQSKRRFSEDWANALMVYMTGVDASVSTKYFGGTLEGAVTYERTARGGNP